MDSTYYDNMKPLDKYMSPLDVWGMALGCMVGWGVFAMPGNTFSEDVEAAKNAGMQAHIAKPIGIAVLMKTLTDVIIADEKKKEDKR